MFLNIKSNLLESGFYDKKLLQISTFCVHSRVLYLQFIGFENDMAGTKLSQTEMVKSFETIRCLQMEQSGPDSIFSVPFKV